METESEMKRDGGHKGLCGHPVSRAGTRGCCYSCYQRYTRLVRAGTATWNELVATGKVYPATIGKLTETYRGSEMDIAYKLLDVRGRTPSKGYPQSAGYDVFPMDRGVIPSGGTAEIPLGFASAFTEGYVAVVDDRGSVGKAMVMHLAGVVDSDYRDEWLLLMYNAGREPYLYSPDRAIAQILFLKVEDPISVIVDLLPPSQRGKGRFGSSDAYGLEKS